MRVSVSDGRALQAEVKLHQQTEESLDYQKLSQNTVSVTKIICTEYNDDEDNDDTDGRGNISYAF
jgi:hypothetical protein